MFQTKEIYEKYDSKEDIVHPDIDAIIDGLQNDDIKKVAENMGNVLEQVMIPDYPVLDEIKKTMMENGALGSMMSGSGPTVFGIFDDREKADSAFNELNGRYPDTFLTRPVSNHFGTLV